MLLDVQYNINSNGFRLNFSGKKRYFISYPLKIWRGLDKKRKNIYIQNYLYSRLVPLSLMANKKIFVHFSEPAALRQIINYGLINDLPRVADIKKINSVSLINRFKKKQTKKQLIFTGVSREKMPPRQKNSENSAVVALSLGKDSLLSYGLAKEIGLKCNVVFVNETEQYNSHEYQFKSKIIKSFNRDQKEKVTVMTDNIDSIYLDKKIKNVIDELENTNGMLAFGLELLPIAYYHRAKYIILGNEQNLNDYYYNKEGLKTYPSFDQTSVYTKKMNGFLKKISNNNVQVISLVEPLYNLAEMKILYNRYKYLLKYLMSCLVLNDAREKWCYECPMCAKAFIYSTAVGGDPKKIGLKKNMFEKKYKRMYPIFNHNDQRVYEKPPEVKEEQLLSFLMAYRQGHRGYLIDLFKKVYLNEAQRHEKKFRKKYFGIHPSLTMPVDINNKIYKIYYQELNHLTN